MTRLHWAIDNLAGEILSLSGWAQALHQAGDLPGSAEKLQAALKLTDLRGERVMHSRVLHALAMPHAAEGALDAAVDHMRRVSQIDRAVGYGHALRHDLIDLPSLHLQTCELSQARVAILEALVWFGFVDDDDALASTQARLAMLEGDGAAGVLSMGTGSAVKSHLSLGEGKASCEFDFALRPARQSLA